MKKILLPFLCILLLSASALAQANQPLLMRNPTLSKTQIVFSYAGDLWVVSRDGGDAARLTNGIGNEYAPIFSPDGRWIAFTGEYDGNTDVYVIPANGGGFGFPGGMGGIQFQPVPLPAPAVPAAPPAKEERVKPKGALNAAPAAAQQVQVVEVQGKLGVNAFQVQVQPAFGIAMAGPGMEMNQVGYNGVGMLDEKNKPVPIIVQQQIGWKAFQPGQKNVQEHIFVFQLEKGQSDNVKLVFLSRKQTTIDIPFTIKDVPLP